MLRNTAFGPVLLAALLAILLSACATTGPGSSAGEAQIRTGVIEQIDDTQIASTHHTGVGAVVGGVIGLGLGSLVGGGHGRDVARVMGTLGGAAVGNAVQKQHSQPLPGQHIVVRMSNGVLVSVTQAPTPGLRVGQRVLIEGNGENARVVPQ